MFDSPEDAEEPLFRVRVVKMTSGERLPLVIDRRGIPVPSPNQWALFIRRPQVQQNTLIEELRTVAHVYEWAARREIDIDERLASGNGLAPAEMIALYQNLRYARATGRFYASHRLTDAADVLVISGKTHAVRVSYAREYLVWGLERALYRLDVSDPRVREIRERCERVRRAAIDFQRSSSDAAAKRIGLEMSLRGFEFSQCYAKLVSNGDYLEWHAELTNNTQFNVRFSAKMLYGNAYESSSIDVDTMEIQRAHSVASFGNIIRPEVPHPDRIQCQLLGAPTAVTE